MRQTWLTASLVAFLSGLSVVVSAAKCADGPSDVCTGCVPDHGSIPRHPTPARPLQAHVLPLVGWATKGGSSPSPEGQEEGRLDVEARRLSEAARSSDDAVSYFPAFTAMSWCAFASASYSLASAS
jgi:hypothetical protein